MEFIHDLQCIYYLNQLQEMNDSADGNRRSGNRKILKTRDMIGFYKFNFKIINIKKPEFFNQYIRMDYQKFQSLLNLLKPMLQKNSRRKPIEPEQRLYITLFFLAQGYTLKALSRKFRIGLETARSIVLDTCTVIWNQLSELYVSPPQQEEFVKIARGFYEKTGLPNCIGALDGKHIKITAHNSGSFHFNNKKFQSIILLAVCDTNYTFTLVDFVSFGTQDILKTSKFGEECLANNLNLPSESKLPETNIVFPHYLVADTVFPLWLNTMRPFSKNANQEMKIYNDAITRARDQIEISFGILTSKWKILLNNLKFSAENAKKLVLATIALHNFLRLNGDDQLESIEENTLQSVDSDDLNALNTTTLTALKNRDLLCKYLNRNSCYDEIIEVYDILP